MLLFRRPEACRIFNLEFHSRVFRVSSDDEETPKVSYTASADDVKQLLLTLDSSYQLLTFCVLIHESGENYLSSKTPTKEFSLFQRLCAGTGRTSKAGDRWFLHTMLSDLIQVSSCLFVNDVWRTVQEFKWAVGCECCFGIVALILTSCDVCCPRHCLVICAALRVFLDHQANEALLNRWHKPAAKNTVLCFHLSCYASTCGLFFPKPSFPNSRGAASSIEIVSIISAFIVPSWNYQNLISVVKLSPAVKLNQVQS